MAPNSTVTIPNGSGGESQATAADTTIAQAPASEDARALVAGGAAQHKDAIRDVFMDPADGQLKVADHPPSECDACPFCFDTCALPLCHACEDKRAVERRLTRGAATATPGCGPCRKISGCELRRHRTVGSCWMITGAWAPCFEESLLEVLSLIVASVSIGKDVIDVSRIVLTHPGGIKPILRRAGTTVDTSDALKFHSNDAKRMWKSFKVGQFVPCPGRGDPVDMYTCSVVDGCAIS
jgi:hypothetical protein